MPIIRFIIFMCLLNFTFVSSQAFALDVKDVRFGAHPDKVRMVLDLSDVADFRAFTLSSPYRLVIDLPDFEWKAGQVKRPAKALISDIRQGKLMPGVSRIVFDLDSPAVIQSAFLLPKQGEKENRIVIDYRLTNAQEFNKEKSTVHGTLNVDNVANETTVATNKNVTPANLDVPVPPRNDVRPSVFTGEKPLIIIDPGHGGQDPGATHDKIYEKHIVLAIAKELERQLLSSGKYRVKLTRDKDVFIRLKDRVKFARKHGGDLFISIHADSIHKPDVSGSSVYTLSQKASDAQTAKLAEKENQADMMAGVDFVVEDEQVAFILGDFLMTDTMNQSKFFANTLVSNFKSSKLKTLQTPHRYAGFAVLKAPDIPSVLIEAGFVSNKREATLLNQPAHRSKLASSIKSGIDAYFDYVHNNERN